MRQRWSDTTSEGESDWMTVQHRPIRGFYDLRLNDANGTPGHRRGNAEGMLATNLKRGGSHEEGVRQQLSVIKVLCVFAFYDKATTHSCLVQHRPIR